MTAAVDCEMCETAQGLELTRLTIIDKDLTVLLDTLVKPKNRIINYLTKYSGITEDLLENVTVTLEQVQLAFMRLISKETYLIGKYVRYRISIIFLFLLLSFFLIIIIYSSCKTGPYYFLSSCLNSTRMIFSNIFTSLFHSALSNVFYYFTFSHYLNNLIFIYLQAIH